MAYTSETDSLLGGKKKQTLLNDDDIDGKSVRDRISEEVFGSFFILLMKSSQVSIPFAVAVILCIIETMQVLSLLTSPIFNWSNALSGIVHDILGITSFISFHIFSAVPLLWIAFALMLSLLISLILLIFFQSAYVNHEGILKAMRGLFCTVSHIMYIPFIILCLSALTCRMGTTANVTDFGYCWNFSLATSTATGANSIFVDPTRPVVSAAIRTVMILAIPAIVVHVALGFTYASLIYDDNPTNAFAKYTSMSHPRPMIVMNLLKGVLTVLIFVLREYIPALLIAALAVLITYTMAHSFIISLPYYNFAINELYAATLTFQCWVAICAFVATALDTPSDHTTAIIVYLTMPLALLMGAQLAQIRRRKIELCDSLELRNPLDCEIKVRFMIEPVTTDLTTVNDVGDMASLLPEHQPYLQKASEWYTHACERWPTDATLGSAAARFHILYLRDTYSSSRYVKRALFSQPALDTQFALYRLQQLITHLYEEQQHAFDFVDTNLLGDDNEMAASKQRRHRDMMINMALERHITEAVNAEAKANRAQTAFWDELSRKRPRPDYLADLAFEVAEHTEKFAGLCAKIENLRKSMNQNTKKNVGNTLTRADTLKNANSTALRSMRNEQDIDDDDENVILSGNIVVTLNPPSRLKPVDKTNPSSVSNTIALNSAVSQLSSVEATVDDVASAAHDEGNTTRTVKSVGGLRSVLDGDKRGYTAQDFVFAADSPFRLEEVDDDVYSMFGFVPEDLFASKLGVGISAGGQTAALSSITATSLKGAPIYNSSVFFFEPHRSEHRDFLRKYALLALHTIISQTTEEKTDVDDHVEAIENSSPIARLLSSFSPLNVLCQHSDGTIFPARILIKPITHPSSPLSLLITFQQLRIATTSGILVAAPDGAVVTASRGAIAFFNPKLHMLLRRPHAPPLLSQQLLSLVGMPIGDSSTAQLDMKTKRAAFSTSMDDHRETLRHYLNTHNINEWLPEYQKLRHVIKQGGITIRIPLTRITENIQKQAAASHKRAATAHYNMFNRKSTMTGSAKSSGKLTGNSTVSAVITSSDGHVLHSLPANEQDFDLTRLTAYEATIRVWVSPMLNRCRIDHTGGSVIPSSVMQRSQYLPATDLPAVGSSNAYRRVASLYMPQHAWKEMGPVLALSPRTKNSFVPMSGMVASSTGFIYEPSELISPLDADFFHKYVRKEQQVKMVRDALMSREQYLFDDTRPSGTNTQPNSARGSARGLQTGGSNSARNGLNSGRLSARGKTTSLLTPRGDDLVPNNMLTTVPETHDDQAHPTAALARHFSESPRFIHQTSVPSMQAFSAMGSMPNLMRQASTLSGPRPGLLHLSSTGSYRGEADSHAEEKKMTQNMSLFPDYGDIIYLDVLELFMPSVDDEIMAPEPRGATSGRLFSSPDVILGEKGNLEPVMNFLNLTGLHEDAVARTENSVSHDSNKASARSQASHIDIATYGEDYNVATAAEDDADVRLPGAIGDDGKHSHGDSDNEIVSARSNASLHSARNNLLVNRDNRSGSTSGKGDDTLFGSGIPEHEDDDKDSVASSSSSKHSGDQLLVDMRVRTKGAEEKEVDTTLDALNNGSGSARGRGATTALSNHTSDSGDSRSDKPVQGKATTTLDIIAERQRLNSWVNDDQGKFSMNIVERYDRYHRCVQFLEQYFNIYTPKKLGIEDPEQVGGHYDNYQASGREVTSQRVGDSMSAPRNAKNQKEDAEMKRLQEKIVGQNQRFAKVLRKFKIFFILSIILVLGLGLMQFLVLLLQSNAHSDSVSYASYVTQREEAATRISFNSFYLNLIQGGYVPSTVQNIGPFTAAIVKNHISSLASILSSAHDRVKSLVDSLVGSASVYTTVSGSAVSMSLSAATVELVNKARNVAALAGTASIATDASIMYTAINGVGDLVTKMSESSRLIAENVQSDMSKLSMWAIIMLSISFAALLFIVIFFIRPTVVTIHKSRLLILTIFKAVPEYPLRQLRAVAALRYATLTSDFDAIQEAMHDVNLFNQRKRSNDDDDTLKIDMPMSKLFLLRVATIFIVAIVFFCVLYFVGYTKLSAHLEDSVTTLYYSSYLSVLTTKTATSLLMLAATSASVTSPHVANLVSFESVRANLDEMELFNTYLVQGGKSDIYSLERSIRAGHVSDTIRDLWFHDACEPIWKSTTATAVVPASTTSGPFSFIDYLPVSLPDCKLFDEHVLKGGLEVALLEFIRLTRSLTDSLEAGTGSTGGNSGVVLDDMAHFETYWRLLSAAQRFSVEAQHEHVEEEIREFFIFSVIAFAVFAVVLLFCYFAFYVPIIVNTNEQLRSIRAMLMFVPMNVLKRVAPYQEWLNNGDV